MFVFHSNDEILDNFQLVTKASETYWICIYIRIYMNVCHLIQEKEDKTVSISTPSPPLPHETIFNQEHLNWKRILNLHTVSLPTVIIRVYTYLNT